MAYHLAQKVEESTAIEAPLMIHNPPPRTVRVVRRRKSGWLADRSCSRAGDLAPFRVMDIAPPAGSTHRRQHELLEASRRLLRQSAETIARTRFVLDQARAVWARGRLRLHAGDAELTLSAKISRATEQTGFLIAETRTARDSVRATRRATQLLRAASVGNKPGSPSRIPTTSRKNGIQAQA